MLLDSFHAIESVVAVYGAAGIFGIFLLEGVLVGKLIPTRALLVGSVALVSGTVVGVLSVFAAAVIGATIGQLLLFGLIRYRDVDAASVVQRARLSSRWSDRAVAWFDRWGLSALFVSNALPGARGYLLIPAAMSGESGYRVSAVAIAGTTVYIALLCLVAVGVGTTLG